MPCRYDLWSDLRSSISHIMLASEQITFSCLKFAEPKYQNMRVPT